MNILLQYTNLSVEELLRHQLTGEIVKTEKIFSPNSKKREKIKHNSQAHVLSILITLAE